MGVSGCTRIRELGDSLFTLQGSGNVAVLSSADSETELVVRDLNAISPSPMDMQNLMITHERHPFLVEDIAAGWDVGRDVSADRVTDVLGTVGVELSSRVTIGLSRDQNLTVSRMRSPLTMFILVPSQKP